MSLDAQIVQALYSFKGTNNDELCFQKGDLITITQTPDGGWWEGTLGEITGWFPSNYVREVKDSAIIHHNPHDAANISIVYKDLLDSEKAHVDELQGLFTNFLVPLERSTILTSDEYKQLIGNFTEVLETHQVLLQFIDEENQKPHKEQKIGRYFLQHAPRMKAIHQAYCSLHPKAVCILDKYKEELTKYMESCGANSPGVLVLTTGLSKPFRRLAKYSGMLLEVERHVEDSHPDRGDIQRSVAVYKEIDAACSATRRQKELELQVLTGPVRGWEGQSLSTLGDIIYMGSVAVGPQHLDRYLVLFPTTLLILSVSHRLSAFIYEQLTKWLCADYYHLLERFAYVQLSSVKMFDLFAQCVGSKNSSKGKLPVTGITVCRLEDSDQYKNAFEISGPLIDKVTAVCQSKDEANHWVDILRKYNPNRSTISNKSPPSQAEMVPQPPPHMSALVATPNSNRSNVRTVTPPSHGTLNNNRGWSACCLRPSPPLRPCTTIGNSSPARNSSRKPVSFEDDAHILEVIEAYFACPRNTVNTAKNKEDKQRNNQSSNLNELLKGIQNKVKNVECNMEMLSSQLTEERAARCALQIIIKKYLMANGKELESIDWPTMESNILS